MTLNSLEMREFIYNLQQSSYPSDVINAWSNFRGDFSKFTAIVALDEYKEIIKIREIVEPLNSFRNCVTFYLNTHNLYFLDEKTLKTMFIKGNVDFKVDYSIMFDTNFASYIRKFVKGIDLGTVGNEFFQLIDILIKKEFQYDYTIYLTENIKQVINPFTINCEISDEIIETIVSFELFKNIDSDEYKTSGKIKYLISYKLAESEAKKTLNTYFRNPKMKPYFDDLFNLKQLILLNLIGMFQVHFSSKSGPKKKMKEYLDFVSTHIGLYLERESIIAYELFSRNRLLSIFNKIGTNMKSEHLGERLDNIAWDFLVPRLMERSIALGGEGDYFIPLLLTFDKGLHNMLKLYPVKGVVFEKGTIGVIPISKLNIDEFFTRNGFYDFIDWFNTDTDSRKKVADHNRDTSYEIIGTQLKQLKEIMFE